MRPQGIALCLYITCQVVDYLCVCHQEPLRLLDILFRLTLVDNIRQCFWCTIYSTIVSLFFFPSFLRSSPPQENCFWASEEWEDFRPGLLLHLPGCPGRACWVPAWWSWCGSGWVPVLPHWWPPRGHRQDGDTPRAACGWHPPLGC